MKFTHRETQVMDLLLEGKQAKQIADMLKISISTVQTYIRLVEAKLDAPNRAVACVKYDRLKR